VLRHADSIRVRPGWAEGCRMKYVALAVIFLGGTMLLQWLPVVNIHV
jgi:hypothetical protein